jgi:ElaA protein
MNTKKEPDMIQWQDLHHSELTTFSLYALLKLRCEVFVVEQTCPYQDIDGDDLVGETVIFWAGKITNWSRMRGF